MLSPFVWEYGSLHGAKWQLRWLGTAVVVLLDLCAAGAESGRAQAQAEFDPVGDRCVRDGGCSRCGRVNCASLV